MKVIVNGACGRMGRQIVSLIQSSDEITMTAAVDKFIPADINYECVNSIEAVNEKADAIIDFSNHTGVINLCKYAVSNKTPLMVATTGFSDDELAAIHAAAEEIPVFLCANTSVGIALLASLARQAAAVMEGADIEIIEHHHNTKLDSPSGTALMLANEICEELNGEQSYVFGRHGHNKRDVNEIGIHSVRMGKVVGVHEIYITNGDETITLRHEAHNRTLLAQGALTAAKYIAGKTANGLYGMKDMLAGK